MVSVDCAMSQCPGSTAVVQWAEEGEAEKRDLGLRVCLTHPKVGSRVPIKYTHR